MGEDETGPGRPVGTGGDQVVTLDTMDGRSVKNIRNMLTYLPTQLTNAISNIPMTRARLSRVNNAISHIVSGIYSSTPLVCCGAECPYVKAGRCPLEPEGLLPVGHDCPVELFLIGSWMSKYADALTVDLEDWIEMDMIGTIVNCDIMIFRVRNYMSRRPDGHIDMNATGVDKQGNVLLTRDISKEILVEERYQRIKDKKLEQLLATRESKARYNVVDSNNPATRGSMVRNMVQEVRARAKGQFLEDVANDTSDTE